MRLDSVVSYYYFIEHGLKDTHVFEELRKGSHTAPDGFAQDDTDTMLGLRLYIYIAGYSKYNSQ